MAKPLLVIEVFMYNRWCSIGVTFSEKLAKDIAAKQIIKSRVRIYGQDNIEALSSC